MPRSRPRVAGSLEDAATVGRGDEVPRVGRSSAALPPGLVHGAGGRAAAGEQHAAPGADAHGLRRPLARLGMGLDRCHRQAQGDDIDIDAAIEARVEVMAGSAPDEAVYVESLRRRRDLSVLLLLDISGSVAEPGATAEDRARAAAGGGRCAHGCASRSRRSRGALRLPLAGAVRRAPGAGEALRRRPRRPRDAASPRPRARRVLETGCGDPAWRGRAGAARRDVAAVARRAVRRAGVRPRLRARVRRSRRAARARRGPPPRVPLASV